MNFIFDDLHNLLNFTNCIDVNPSGIHRFSRSPIVDTLMRYTDNKYTFNNISFDDIKRHSDPTIFEKYILATGVTHSPWDWTGPDDKNNGFNSNYPDRKNLFSYLSVNQLSDIQTGKMFLLLDQSHEGYHVDWLFDWFHNSCRMFNINPKQIIYITGDMEVYNKYVSYCVINNVHEKILALPHSHFENAVQTAKINRVKLENQPPLKTFDENFLYKKEHLHKIKIYNCLQKRPRAHRMWMFNKLYKHGLLESGINSMNHFELISTYYMNKSMTEQEYLPLCQLLPMLPPSEDEQQEIIDFASEDSGKYPMMFNEQVMLDSFVSVISESSFGEDTCFISEKTFKTFGIEHPFIIFGNKHTLKNLKILGYQTLSPLIDENYDDMDTWDRLDAIIHILNDLKSKSPQQLLNWYYATKEIMKFNSKVLYNNSIVNVPFSYVMLQKYFREQNV